MLLKGSLSETLHWAIQNQNWDTFMSTLKCPNVDVNVKNTKGETPLIVTLSFWDKKQAFGYAFNLLLAGADVNSQCDNGEAPIHLIAELNLINHGNRELVYLILRQHGLKMNTQNRFGQTALHLTKSLEMVEILHTNGCDLNRRDGAGETPLFLNIEDPEILEYLINNGANINEINKCGYTPLVCAFLARNVESMKILLENGANHKVKVEGMTIFTACYKWGCDDKIKKLLWKYTEPAQWATAVQYEPSTMQHVLEKWQEVVQKDPRKITHHANELLKLIKRQSLNFEPCYVQLLLNFLAANIQTLNKFYIHSISQHFHATFDTFILNHLLLCFTVPTDDYAMIYKIANVLISSGCVVDFDDVNRLYCTFGDSMILKQAIIHRSYIHRRIKQLHQICLFPQILRNIKIDLGRFLHRKSLYHNQSLSNIHGIACMTRYCVLPPKLLKRWTSLMQYYGGSTNPDTDDSEDAVKLPVVPSLKELSRNAARSHLVDKFKFTTPKQVRDYLIEIGAPMDVREIILLERPIYKTIYKREANAILNIIRHFARPF